MILTDASGRPYASSGYEEGGPETYLGILTKLRKIRESRDAAFEKAAKSEGVEKAKALAEGLKEIDPKFVHSFYAKEVELIVSLDKDDVTGLKAEQNAHKLEAEETAVLEGVGEKLQELQPKLEKLMEDKDVKGFETAMDEFIAENKLSGVGKQFIIIQKLAVYGPERIDEASKLLDTVIAIDPKSQIGRQAVEMKENIKEMKKSVDKSKTDGASKEEDGEPETEDKEAAEKEEKADSKKEKAE